MHALVGADIDCKVTPTTGSTVTVTLSVRSVAVAHCNYPQFPVGSLSGRFISMGNICGAASTRKASSLCRFHIYVWLYFPYILLWQSLSKFDHVSSEHVFFGLSSTPKRVQMQPWTLTIVNHKAIKKFKKKKGRKQKGSPIEQSVRRGWVRNTDVSVWYCSLVLVV